MLKRISIATVFVATAIAATPAHASQVIMTGHVRTVCQIASSDPNETAPNVLSAQMDIFCNSTNGATISASLITGDLMGYTFSTGGVSTPLRPGETSDILFLNTAFNGSQMLQITPIVDQPDPVVPVVTFEILAE